MSNAYLSRVYGLKHHWQIAAFVWLETALYTLQSAETELEAAHKDKSKCADALTDALVHVEAAMRLLRHE